MNDNEKWVSKPVVKDHRDNFTAIINAIRPNVKMEGVSFTFRLVGSAKRNLVIRHHNNGFDCDYQIFIQKNTNEIKAKELKKLFMDEMDKEVDRYGFDKCKDSTRAITIENIDQENSIIINSYDVVIITEKNEEVKILNNDKDSGIYDFQLLPKMTKSNERFKKIQGQKMWECLREKYYDKKMANENLPKAIKKKSFQVLNETVSEVLTKFKIKLE